MTSAAGTFPPQRVNTKHGRRVRALSAEDRDRRGDRDRPFVLA